jgi:hypothetical protein
VERAAERTALRRSAAWRLRRLADRMDPRPRPRLPRPTAAPLVRLGGRWWQRDALLASVDEPD